MKPDEIWGELKRRRVVRVALAYAAALFVVLQVADLTFEPLGLPDAAYRILLMIGLAGFPIAVALAWAFDVTPEGVRAADSAAGAGSRRLGPVVIGAAVIAAAGVGYWQFSDGRDPDPVGEEGIDPGLIAVVPFRVSSPDERVAILREGVIDMLAPVFSRSPRIVDTGAMISAWRVFIAGDESMELSEGQAVELARRLGAGRALVGSVVGSAESFVLNARLLSVPDGALIGDASVDGSADGLRETLSQLAGQVLSMEAGVGQGQIDYLSDVPLGALEAYLEGRRAYRRTAWVEARTAFSRALDEDSTFALAALGAWEAVQMGLDADRLGLGTRANRLLRDHLDRLPPRDREFVELWLSRPYRRSATELVRESGSQMVSRMPDKAEAWYVYGDQLFHAAWRVAERDWQDRALEAFERAKELDPGLTILDEHLIYAHLLSGDTTGLRDRLTQYLEQTGATGGSIMARGALAYHLNDPEQQEWIRANLERLSYADAQMVVFALDFPGSRMPIADVDRAFDRLERSAIAAGDRDQTLELRYRYLRSAGRSAEADDALRTWEAATVDRPRAWVEAFLYWDGLREPAAAAAATLAREVGSGTEALEWARGGRDACALELWRLRDGDTSTVARTVERLRAGADDPDPAHGQNALCALTLETVAAHRSNAPEAGRLVAQLTEVLDQGPSTVLQWSSLELAWILEGEGDLGAAARVAGYTSGNVSVPFAHSTVNREAGRLADALGDADRAIYKYEWYLSMRGAVDERLSPQDVAIRARVEQLKATAGR
ncbi:MAG: hypothetical protein OEN56_04015 [Gemmatimonadota bacterium]|nr:hypothetical protein [Gemmatimonadota bacterium]